MAEPRGGAGGHRAGESPRWHDGRIWFCDRGAGEVDVAVGAVRR